jgi:hypothetical protein
MAAILLARAAPRIDLRDTDFAGTGMLVPLPALASPATVGIENSLQNREHRRAPCNA